MYTMTIQTLSEPFTYRIALQFCGAKLLQIVKIKFLQNKFLRLINNVTLLSMVY